MNDTLLEDTRIPPEGFAPPPDADAAPLGRDYAGEAGAYRHWDDVDYALRELCGTGTLTLRARLRYQTTTREYAEFLRDEAPPSPDPALEGRSWGQVAYDAWRAHGGDQPVDMETVEVTLGPAPRTCPEPDAGPPPMDAGTPANAGREPESRAGCGCRTGAERSPGRGLGLALALAAVVASRRRRGRAARAAVQFRGLYVLRQKRSRNG